MATKQQYRIPKRAYQSAGLIVCALILGSAPLCGQDRVALLIGNTDYGEHQLPEARANIEQLGKALESIGFHVTLRENIEKDFRQELESFVPSCPNGGVSLVYFCGYGSQYDRKMSRTIELQDGTKQKQYYTEPDSGIWSTAGREPYLLDDIVRVFRDRSHARVNLLLLDCGFHCPMASEEQQGLIAPEISEWPSGLICMAAPPREALPSGKSSFLAESLARHLVARAQPLGEIMTNIQADVAKRSSSKQKLWLEYSLPKDTDATIVPSRLRNVSASQLPPNNPQPGDEWINSIGMVFCWCPAGKFRMGLPETTTPYTSDATHVEAAISNGFWISKYEVALGDYSRARYGRDKPLRGPLGFIPYNVSNVPLTSISPDGCSGFLKNLNSVESKAGQLPKSWFYRLPTEAEWEYACRAGANSRYSFGDSPAELARFGNFADAELHRQNSDFYYSDTDSNDRTGERPAPIGSYEPNAWGVHDMHGNVSEICADRYTNRLPGGVDPWVPRADGGDFVIRGGSWASTAEYCQAGFRNSVGTRQSSGEFANVGLRVVLTSKHVSEK